MGNTLDLHVTLPTALRQAGIAVLPTPRMVHLDGKTTAPTRGWQFVAENDSCPLAADTLCETLKTRALSAITQENETGLISWQIKPDAVDTQTGDPRHLQAYSLTITHNRIALIANAAPGLFYGLQTLIQIFESCPSGGSIPCGTITDWPERELRFVHWDTKHHQDRLETLRRYVDELARFKVNMVCFELEDKFVYPSHPVIGAPDAFTSEELTSLVKYALERHIQIVPNVQSPAHMCYVLKHPEFTHLRCDGSNYQSCMDKPEVRRLLFDMYEDLIEATPGVEYFHVSTDEVYYAGICEKFRSPYNPENRSLTWVDYVRAAHAFLRQRGRRMLIWGEYPLLPEHICMLPPDIIDGVVGEEEYLKPEAALGMRQLIYASLQGVEPLMPRYFAFSDINGLKKPGRLHDITTEYLSGRATRGQPIGTFAAAWDDSGLHNELFWPGWLTMAQYAWNCQPIALEQTIADFMDVFYGKTGMCLTPVWKALHHGAVFYEKTWLKIPSRSRPPAYGDWDAKKATLRIDYTLELPFLPNEVTADTASSFRKSNQPLLNELPSVRNEIEQAIDILQTAMTRVKRNRYNLQVLLAVAWIERHHCEMLETLAISEKQIERAFHEQSNGNHATVKTILSQTLAQIDRLLADFEKLRQAVTQIWEISRLPRNASVNGKQFVHIMDDVKDHRADRTVDLSYIFDPELNIDLPAWRNKLAGLIEK